MVNDMLPVVVTAELIRDLRMQGKHREASDLLRVYYAEKLNNRLQGERENSRITSKINRMKRKRLKDNGISK